MAKKIKHYRRKDLVQAPDEFLTLTEQAVVWSGTNWPTVIIAAGVIVVMAVVGLLVKSSMDNSKNEFNIAFKEAVDVYNAPLKNEGMPPMPGVPMYDDDKKKYDDAQFKFEKLLKENPKNIMAPRIQLYVADCIMKKGDYEKAEASYDQIIGSQPADSYLTVIAKTNKATALYMEGEYEPAFKLFKQIADDKTNKTDMVAALVYAARSAEKLNKIDDAVKYYQLAVDSYSDSLLTSGLKEKIAQLKMGTEHVSPAPTPIPAPAPAPINP